MVLLELFWSFLKIGFTRFGGLSMIPLITEEMLSHGWMTAEQVSDIVGIAEMTPGPVGLNCATFAGIRAAHLPGALAANLGVLMPSLTLCVLAAVFFAKVKDSVPTKYKEGANVRNSIIADGCEVGGTVENSILFRSVKVGKGAVIRNSIVMENGIVMENAQLDYVITDKSCIIQSGRRLAGYESYPMVVVKNKII